MEETTVKRLADLFLALSDRTRLRLLDLMSGGEVSVGYLADRLGESQPKISRHLATLRQLDLVKTRRDGKWIYYELVVPHDPKLAEVLECTFGLRRDPVATAKSENTYAEPYVSEREDELEVFLL